MLLKPDSEFWIYTIVILVFCISSNTVESSRGDRDYTFHRCMNKCQGAQCNGTEYQNQPISLQFLGWDCEGECQYLCMWETVKLFEQHDLPIPQFYGKWPFIRIAGIQEPASVVASLCNLIVHVFGIVAFRSRIAVEAPLYWFWHLFSMICINGWIWSTIFHTRDTPSTEAMDYFCAFSMVTFSFFSAFVRMFEGKSSKVLTGIAVLISSFFAYHVYYLAYIKFDYGYNMKANIAIGLLNALCWVIWGWRNGMTKLYVWKCNTFIILALASISLEVLDFAPILWTFDSHALWHFSTALITPLWYSFLIDDCYYLHETTKYKML